MSHFLPPVKTVLEVMHKFDREYYSRSQFPALCYETSVLMYIWIKKNDKMGNVELVSGQYNWKNNDINKRNDSMNSIFHVWIEYENKIIDYTHIQFDLDKRGIDSCTLAKLEKEYDLKQYPYEYDKNDIHYSDTTLVNLCPHLEYYILNLIKNIEVNTFQELAGIYISLINELRYKLNKCGYRIEIFNLVVQAYYWYNKYDLVYFEKLRTQYYEILEEYFSYLLTFKR